MKNGDLTDFLDKLFVGSELLFIYEGKTYFIQGWLKEKVNHLEVFVVKDDCFQGYKWIYEAETMKQCADKFLTEKMWGGKNFLEIESDVTWTDW